MMKRITAILAATLMISLPVATASPRSDGYYGKTKVGPKAQIEAHPFDLGQVKLLPSPFERRRAISGLTPLCPLISRRKVDGETPSFNAMLRRLRFRWVRNTSRMNSPGWGGLYIVINGSPRNPRRKPVHHQRKTQFASFC